MAGPSRRGGKERGREGGAASPGLDYIPNRLLPFNTTDNYHNVSLLLLFFASFFPSCLLVFVFGRVAVSCFGRVVVLLLVVVSVFWYSFTIICY